MKKTVEIIIIYIFIFLGLCIFMLLSELLLDNNIYPDSLIRITTKTFKNDDGKIDSLINNINNTKIICTERGYIFLYNNKELETYAHYYFNTKSEIIKQCNYERDVCVKKIKDKEKYIKIKNKFNCK
jgi:hypothetical protein